MRIRISGQGEAGIRGNNNGDLFIGISISNHKVFFRDADDLIIKITIPMIVAVLGDKIEIPCIDGESIELKIPNGTQNLQRFRVKSKGMCILNSKTRGDLYIDVNISIPSSLTDKQKEALKTLFLTTEKVKINYN
jgi:molecular chaperone DnaJ